MNKCYKVIWFDDEHESLSNIIEHAHLNDIQLIGFNNALDGITDLKINYHKYDAVLVDGKFYRKPGLSGDAIDNLAFTDVMKELRSLKSIKILPYFLLSGKTSFTRDKNELIEVFEIKRTYDKLNNDDIAALWENIKIEADKQIDTQTRHDHPEIFSIFHAGYLGVEVELQVLELIKVALPTNRVDTKALLSNIRSIQESCLLKLEEISVIPNAQAPINIVLKHLSGNKSAASNWQATSKEYQNDAIENLHKWIYFTCGKYIHNLKDENYNDYLISNYAVESLRTGLLELLLWFKKTYEENKEHL
jgi:hypothetical protein